MISSPASSWPTSAAPLSTPEVIALLFSRSRSSTRSISLWTFFSSRPSGESARYVPSLSAPPRTRSPTVPNSLTTGGASSATSAANSGRRRR